MKTSYIIALVILAFSVGVIISLSSSASQYVDFEQACDMAKSGRTAEVHVVGKLKKSKEGRILELNYNPVQNPNLCTFTLVDNKNKPYTVVYRNPKPQDLERSEQVVIIGKVQGETFEASKILLKCPSKYEEKEVKI
jgi:cytochrome c-type biogenesis protein CcmE